MRQAALEFHIGDSRLEGVLTTPAGLRPPFHGVVVCHAHPLFGGHMDSAVTYSICSELAARGMASLRFNFRPFKDGATDAGGTAAEDVARALGILQEWRETRGRRLGVAGYSAGAAAIARGLAGLADVRAIALVSPPLSAVESPAFAADVRPRLLLVGSEDRIMKPDELQAAAGGMSQPPVFEVLPGADHTLRGHEPGAARRVAAFMEEQLMR